MLPLTIELHSRAIRNIEFLWIFNGLPLMSYGIPLVSLWISKRLSLDFLKDCPWIPKGSSPISREFINEIQGISFGFLKEFHWISKGAPLRFLKDL